MKTIERIEILYRKLGYKSLKNFAEEVGLRPQVFYDIRYEKCDITRNVAMKIHNKFENVNLLWLMNGAGPMLSNDTPDESDDESSAIKKGVNRRVIEIINGIVSTGETKVRIASELNMSAQSFSQMLSGRIGAGVDVLAILCAKFSANPEYLLLGVGKKLVNPNDNPGTIKSPEQEHDEVIALRAENRLLRQQYSDLLQRVIGEKEIKGQ